MNMKKLVLLNLLSSCSTITLADQVTYELGSYREKILLTYTEHSIKLSNVQGGRESVVCSNTISEETLSHSLAFFEEVQINSWEPTYFVEGRMDGAVFKLSADINDVHIASMGHLEKAPKEHKRLVRYFNQLLVLNGCEKIS